MDEYADLDQNVNYSLSEAGVTLLETRIGELGDGYIEIHHMM